MVEPLHKRAKLPERWPGLPTSEVQALHHQLCSKCLCQLQLPHILDTLNRCNVHFGASSSHQIAQGLRESLLYISLLTLFFEVALKQRNHGHICTRISEVVLAGADSEGEVLHILFRFLGHSNKYISYSAMKALVSLMLLLQGPISELVLSRLADIVQSSSNWLQVGHACEALKRVIEWKDLEEHPLGSTEDASPPQGCRGLKTEPADAYGTNEVKTSAIKILDCVWHTLVTRSLVFLEIYNIDNEHVTISFLSMWTSLISVKNNLNVDDTKEFYSGLDTLLNPLLSHNTPVMVWEKILDLFNEVLCYGSTLALQEVLAEEPCNLAHLLIRAVNNKDFLEFVPCGQPAEDGYQSHTDSHSDTQTVTMQPLGHCATSSQANIVHNTTEGRDDIQASTEIFYPENHQSNIQNNILTSQTNCKNESQSEQSTTDNVKNRRSDLLIDKNRETTLTHLIQSNEQLQDDPSTSKHDNTGISYNSLDLNTKLNCSEHLNGSHHSNIHSKHLEMVANSLESDSVEEAKHFNCSWSSNIQSSTTLQHSSISISNCAGSTVLSNECTPLSNEFTSLSNEFTSLSNECTPLSNEFTSLSNEFTPLSNQTKHNKTINLDSPQTPPYSSSVDDHFDNEQHSQSFESGAVFVGNLFRATENSPRYINESEISIPQPCGLIQCVTPHSTPLQVPGTSSNRCSTSPCRTASSIKINPNSGSNHSKCSHLREVSSKTTFSSQTDMDPGITRHLACSINGLQILQNCYGDDDGSDVDSGTELEGNHVDRLSFSSVDNLHTEISSNLLRTGSLNDLPMNNLPSINSLLRPKISSSTLNNFGESCIEYNNAIPESTSMCSSSVHENGTSFTNAQNSSAQIYPIKFDGRGAHHNTHVDLDKPEHRSVKATHGFSAASNNQLSGCDSDSCFSRESTKTDDCVASIKSTGDNSEKLCSNDPSDSEDGNEQHTQMSMLLEDDAESFGHNTDHHLRHVVFRKAVLLILKAIAVTVKEARGDSSPNSSASSANSSPRSGATESETEDMDMEIIGRSLKEVLVKVDTFVKRREPYHPHCPIAEWLVKLFATQDDWMVEAMVCGLDIYTGLGHSVRGVSEQLESWLCPHKTFFMFLETVRFDPMVLLDLLVNSETCFLLYLLRYLKIAKQSWASLQQLQSLGNLRQAVGVLRRLKETIMRLIAQDLFPYNIAPVLRLLDQCYSVFKGV